MRYINLKSIAIITSALILWSFNRSTSIQNPPSSTEFSKSSGAAQSFTGPLNSDGDVEHMTVKLASLEKSLYQGAAPRAETLYKLASLSYNIAENSTKNEQLYWYEKGRFYAEILTREEPQRVEGHYWLALNLCGIIENSGAGRALAIIPSIMQTLKTAVEIDETFDQGGPLRVLGLLLDKAPVWPMSEGDPDKSLILLRNAVRVAPENATNHLYLAKALMDIGHSHEACLELDRALASKGHASSELKLKEDHEEARSLKSECAAPAKRDIRADFSEGMIR